MSLQVKRNEEESWRQCVERYAKPYGLEIEALEFFDKEVAAGLEEGQAAWNALYDWDLLDYVEPGEKSIAGSRGARGG